MIYGSAIPLHLRPKFSEGSKLASPRDDRSNSQLWKKQRTDSNQTFAATNQLQKLSREVGKMRRRIVGGGSQTATTQDFQLVSDGGDYYNCYTWDGVNVGSDIVRVAKNQDLRCILPTATPAGGAWPQKTKRGVTYTYTYNAVAGTTADKVNVIEYTRDVTGSDDSSATSEIAPCLNVGDIITAIATSFSGPDTLKDVVWQALADGRAWTDTTTS